MKDRYNRLDRDASITDIFPEKADDFRNFVHEFPIDDAISECFALTAAEDLYKEKLVNMTQFVKYIHRKYCISGHHKIINE